MNLNFNRAITLIELLISICLLGMVLVGLYSIDLFSRRQFLTTDKKGQVQNEAIYMISHINKNLMMAIGDSSTAVTFPPTSGLTINATIDFNHNGASDDGTSQYCFNNTVCGNSNGSYSLYFTRPAAAYELLSSHVKSFSANKSGSLVRFNITTCWDPAEISQSCGSLDNPAFDVTSSVRMPSVSVN